MLTLATEIDGVTPSLCKSYFLKSPQYYPKFIILHHAAPREELDLGSSGGDPVEVRVLS